MKQKKELIERIGIDKTVLGNIKLLDIDVERFQKRQEALEKKQFAVLEMFEDAAGERRIRKLLIKDKLLGQLSIEYKKTNLDGKYRTITSLHIVSSANGNNLQNMDVASYYKRVREVVAGYQDLYGIQLDISQARLKKIEINATFELKEVFQKYKRVVLLMMSNAPDRYRDAYSNTVKIHFWNEIKDDSVRLETALVKNHTTELKVYNKMKQLKDCKYVSDNVDEDVMRIEYTLKDERMIERQTGGFHNLSDRKLKVIFWNNFQRDFIYQYKNWEKQNYQELKAVIEKHLADNKQDWCSRFFRDIRQSEVIHNKPLLFDIGDIKQILEHVDVQNPSRSYQRLLQTADFEDDLIGQKEKVQEIFERVLELCQT